MSLPSYLPDLPEIRSDYAAHLESVQDVDTWLGFFLKDLKDRGLDKNTIIFFFSDHGGCLPRGKGYLYESGLKVPLIIYFPPKWRHLAKVSSGKEYGLINFTDLAPTVLSLAGVRPPRHMQGNAIYGKFVNKGKREMQFALALINYIILCLYVQLRTGVLNISEVIFHIVSLLYAIIINGACLQIKYGMS